MKDFKLKIRDFERKVKKAWKKCKIRIEFFIQSVEVKFGKENRCRLCDEKIFCERYFTNRTDTFFKPARCKDSNSER